jgi:hypothetical protein
MAALTTWEVFAVGFLGGLAATVGLALFVLLALALYAVAARLHEALAGRRERRHALRDGRRQLASLTTIDDFKDSHDD